ncbi:MAG: alpha-L-fucosidase [Arcanobacterium sp.]|nr:alpha-L-fucosidase [Arcanobacterium sp.]
MLNFDERTGPDLGVSYPNLEIPQWWQDAKLGFFIHLGLFSIPAWAITGDDPVAVEDEYAYHRYAEWYGNTVRIPGSPTWKHHREVYGEGTSYEDLAELWKIQREAVEQLVDAIAATGAKYVVPTTKHHDGFCLWDTQTTSFNSVKRGPKLDIIDAVVARARANQMRVGLYYSGALDWHVSDQPPIQSDRELFLFRRHDESFSRYCSTQLSELIERYAPDVLWNDIEWPDGGKGPEEYGLAALFAKYFAAVPDGAINDRWGVPVRSFSTREYRKIDELLPYPWEATRGLARSFGYNAADTEENSLSGAELIRYFVDVVAKNGNLLINVGPRADGSIPEVQLQAMRELGEWMKVFGDFIYGTRPYREGIIEGHAYLEKDGQIFVFAASGEEVVLPPELAERNFELVSEDSKYPLTVARIR